MVRIKNMRWITGLILAFGCCALYAGLISFKTMPISEGWYTEYAWQINHGNLPYRDFEYLFFPLYMYIIAGFTKIFGYSIIALRILGILVYGGIGAMLYCLFSKIFDNVSGLVSAVIASLYLQSEVGQMFYDYIRFHDLFAIATAYVLYCSSVESFAKKRLEGHRMNKISSFFTQILVPMLLIIAGYIGIIQNNFLDHPVRTLALLVLFCMGVSLLSISVLMKKGDRDNKRVTEISIKSIICGVFVAAECLIKQSNGVLMIAFICLYLIYCGIVFKNKYFLKDLFGVLSGIIVSFGIFLIQLLTTGSLDAFLRCCFGNALAAKGGLAATLFRWIPSSVQLFWNEREIAIIIIMFIYIMVERYMRKQYPNKKLFGGLNLSIAGVFLAAISIMFVKNIEWASWANAKYDVNIPAVAFFLCSIMFFGYALYVFFCFLLKKELTYFGIEWFPLFSALGVVFAQGYGSGMSGGLATSQTAIGFGILLALCMHIALRAKVTSLAIGVAAISLLLGSTFIGRKTVQTYNWWGLTQDAISQHTEYVEVPILKGIQVREMDKVYYETIYNDVLENTQPGDSIFAFPQCPIVYTMTDRHSLTYSKVQWFDVSSNDSIVYDIEILKNNLPKMIVYVDLPAAVYEGHEGAFATYQTRVMRDFLLHELIPQNGYIMLNEKDLGNGFTVGIYLLPE